MAVTLAKGRVQQGVSTNITDLVYLPLTHTPQLRSVCLWCIFKSQSARLAQCWIWLFLLNSTDKASIPKLFHCCQWDWCFVGYYGYSWGPGMHLFFQLQILTFFIHLHSSFYPPLIKPPASLCILVRAGLHCSVKDVMHTIVRCLQYLAKWLHEIAFIFRTLIDWCVSEERNVMKEMSFFLERNGIKRWCTRDSSSPH